MLGLDEFCSSNHLDSLPMFMGPRLDSLPMFVRDIERSKISKKYFRWKRLYFVKTISCCSKGQKLSHKGVLKEGLSGLFQSNFTMSWVTAGLLEYIFDLGMRTSTSEKQNL